MILITGGCGYVGSELVKSLLKEDHKIIVYDIQWFGNFLQDHPNLKIINGDLRDLSALDLNGVKSIIHLANIANDPAVEMNPTLSWEVNVLGTQQLLEKAIRSSTVDHFIYASSGSVYGIKNEEKVTEDLELIPISIYNKTKMVAERVVLSYSNHFPVHCIRPATVCGMSARMRLDVSVNMLAFQALENKKITVFGGEQTRPNIHIKDMVNVYKHFLKFPQIETGCYNAGFENISILEIAKKIKRYFNDCEIEVSTSNDQRSYRQDSQKLLNTGFVRNCSVDIAIQDIVDSYKKGNLKNLDQWYTVKTMKKKNVT